MRATTQRSSKAPPPPSGGLAPSAILERPPTLGLAARGRSSKPDRPNSTSLLPEGKRWSPAAVRIYAQAAGAQWDPATAIPWAAEFDLPDELEGVVVADDDLSRGE